MAEFSDCFALQWADLLQRIQFVPVLSFKFKHLLNIFCIYRAALCQVLGVAALKLLRKSETPCICLALHHVILQLIDCDRAQPLTQLPRTV